MKHGSHTVRKVRTESKVTSERHESQVYQREETQHDLVKISVWNEELND